MNTTSITVTATTPDNPEATGWKRNPTSGSGLMDNEDTSTATGDKSAGAFIRTALGRVGATYVYGAEASPDNPQPAAFDCSELVEWAAARVGVFIPDGSQAQRAYCISKGQGMTVAAAIKTAGALLFTDSHVAISLGNGSTVEAVGTGYGVRVMSATQRSFGWAAAGRIPGMRY
jgi:cell wall-associated NlpC family hydrolase